MNLDMRNQSRLMQSVLTMITVPAACVIWANAHAQPDQAPQFTGKELVDIHCVRCHMAPDPADLSKVI